MTQDSLNILRHHKYKVAHRRHIKRQSKNQPQEEEEPCVRNI